MTHSSSHQELCDVPSVQLTKVMNDVNYELSIGTNWSLDMFITGHFIVEARADSNMFPANDFTSTKGPKILAIIFQLFPFWKHLNNATGVMLAEE